MVLRHPVLLVFTIAAVILSNCRGPAQPHLGVDMRAEYEAGRFRPAAGDAVSVAGDFNGWQRDAIVLTDPDEDRVYTAPMAHLAGAPGASPDSLAFKFVVTPGDGRELAARGWETISNRRHARSELRRGLVLRFNEPHDDRVAADVTFRVDLRNQMVLGFFDPARGDRVVVTGSFLDWSPEGVALDAARDAGRYAGTVRVRYRPGVPVEYKFRILPGAAGPFLPADGWESRPNRVLGTDGLGGALPYVHFSDLRRVARFVVDTERWEAEGRFRPEEGEMLQVRLVLDGDTTLTDVLFPAAASRYEAAVALPMQATHVTWEIVRDLGAIALTPRHSLKIGVEGGRVVWPGGAGER